MDIGAKITLLREKKGWSQNKLAKESGVSQQGLNKIERGLRPTPSLESLQKIASALGVSMAEFDETPAKLDTIREQVLAKMETMNLTGEEQTAFAHIKKMPLNKQQESFLKAFNKFKSLSEPDQEAIIKIIDSLASTRQ